MRGDPNNPVNRGSDESEQLQSRGVSVSLDRDELVLRSASEVPSDLLAQVKEHKVEMHDQLSAQICECLDVERFYDDYSEGTGPCKLCGQRCFCPTCKGCRWCGPHPGGKPARSMSS